MLGLVSLISLISFSWNDIPFFGTNRITRDMCNGSCVRWVGGCVGVSRSTLGHQQWPKMRQIITSIAMLDFSYNYRCVEGGEVA